MGSNVFVGIDHGGTATTALVFDIDRGKLASHSVPMPKKMPKIGWVEHDPEDFLESSLGAATGALKKANLSWHDVAGIGFANQGETSMAWSSDDGMGIGPALSWEDRRNSNICVDLATKGVDDLVRARTGIHLDPYFSATKFRWLIDNVADIKATLDQGMLRLGGTETYVINRLTSAEVHATEAGTASRTSLLNLRDVRWDNDILHALDLLESTLPEIRPSCGDYGIATHPDFNGASVPITADAVDAHAALFAQGCRDNTIAKATFGTGAFIEVITGTKPMEPDGKLPVFIAWELDKKIDYTIEGGVFSVGSAIDWMVRSGWISSAADSSSLAQSVSNSGGVSMVPSFTGLSAPHWNSNARASIDGLGLDTEPGHIARALLDGIAYQCGDIVKALNSKLGNTIVEVRADGGPTKNSYLMQRQSDLLDMPVKTSLEPDMTALGAAYMAAMGANQLTTDDIASIKQDVKIYEPSMSKDERESMWDGWQKNVENACIRAGQQ